MSRDDVVAAAAIVTHNERGTSEDRYLFAKTFGWFECQYIDWVFAAHVRAPHGIVLVDLHSTVRLVTDEVAAAADDGAAPVATADFRGGR